MTFIFWAGSSDVNSTLNLKPLAVYSPFAKVLNCVKLGPILQAVPAEIVALELAVTVKEPEFGTV